MLGSGTQTDPLVPTTWEEFITAVGTPGAYAAFPEGGGVIDMSDRGFFENTSASAIMFPILCAEIKGNGWKIRGVSWKTAHLFGRNTSSNDTLIEDLHFTDFYGLLAGEFFAFSKNTINFKNCTTSGVLDSTDFVYQYTNAINFEQCSMAFELRGDATVNSESYKAIPFKNCNIKLTGETSHTGSIIKSSGFDFSYLSGELTFTNSAANLLDDTSSTASTHYSIIDIGLINGGSGNSIIIDNKGAKIVNKDKIKGFTTINLDDDTFAVNEEQLHDAAYLNSIGFAIGVD